MTTVAVCGCSFSDYCEVTRPYGVVFAEKIGYNYLHLAQGCGSNDRVIKEVVDAIITGKLVSDDLVIIQWPEPTRQEVPTLFNNVEDLKKNRASNKPDELPPVRNSNMGEYAYYNWKSNLNPFESDSLEKTAIMFDYCKSLEATAATNELFFLHKWQVYHTLIESICKLNNIKLLIYWHRNISSYTHLAEQIIGKKCSNLMYKDDFRDKYDLESIMLGDGDLHHYNELGHSLAAEHLFNHYLHVKDKL